MSDTMMTVTMLLVMVPSVVVHEMAHAYAADALGDPTARQAGRLSPNPLRHVDPVGSVAVPLAMAVALPFVIAWARPVPVVVANLRRPRVHSLYVALAGPASNIAAAALAVGLFRVLRPEQQSMWWVVLALVTIVNVVLAIYNLLPIPPLDGSALIEFLLPRSWLAGWYRLRPLSILLLIGLVLVGRRHLDGLLDWAVDLWRRQQ